MITLTKVRNGVVNLELEQGTTNSFEIPVYSDFELTEEADLAGYEARCMFREDYGDIMKFPALITPSCSISGNVVTVEIYPDDSSNCSVKSGVYDVELYIPATPELIVHRAQQGTWKIDNEATV